MNEHASSRNECTQQHLIGSEQRQQSRSRKASHTVSIHILALMETNLQHVQCMQKHTLQCWGKEPHASVMCHL